jgi:hypothetical protein
MCDAMPGWRRKVLSGGMESAETTDTQPEGFIRLAPAPPQLTRDHVAHARPAGGMAFSLVAMATAGLAVFQALVPWGPLRMAVQAAGVLVMFGGLGVWTRSNRRSAAAGQLCSCECLPVWIRVVPSIAEPRRTPAEDQHRGQPMRIDAEDSLVGADRVTRS